MIGERTADGHELRLRARGAGRYVGAAFLSVWLCGWAVGEMFALWVLLRGGYALLTGRPPAPDSEPLAAGLAAAAGAFLLVWLAFWTLGGVMALRELLTLLAGEDRITAGPDGLTVSRSRGPFRSRRHVPRDQLLRVRTRGRAGPLVVETSRGTRALTRLGTSDQRREAAEELRRELGLREDVAADAGLPDGWEETLTPEGERVLVASPRARRRQATVTAAIAVAAALAALAVAGRALADLAFVPLAAMVCAATAGIAWGALWLARGRMEWRIGGGRLVQRRRYGSSVRDVFEARRLELDTSRDSDGDEWFTLDGIAADAPEPATGRRVSRRTRRRVASTLRDPEALRRLGLWLATRADVPFHDRTGAEFRAADLAALRAELEKAGGVGRIVGRLIDGVEARHAREQDPGGA